MQPNQIGGNNNPPIPPIDENDEAQPEENQAGIGSALRRVGNFTYDLITTLSPFNAPPPVDEQGNLLPRINLRPLEPRLFMQQALGMVRVGVDAMNGAGAAIGALQVLMMMRTAHAAPPPPNAPPPIVITEAHELAQLNGSNGTFLLGGNITATQDTGNITDFTGTLDGGGFTINELRQPLFNTLNGTVRNLRLSNALVSVTDWPAPSSAGVLAGTSSNANIDNVNVTSSYVYSGSRSAQGSYDDNTDPSAPAQSALAGGLVGQDTGGSTITNINVENTEIEAQANTQASPSNQTIAGGVIGQAEGHDLTANNLAVRDSRVAADSPYQTMSGGAIGNANQACGTEGEASSCDGITVSNTRVTSRTIQPNQGLSTGIFGSTSSVPETSSSSTANVRLTALNGCKSEMTASLAQCSSTSTTEPTPAPTPEPAPVPAPDSSTASPPIGAVSVPVEIPVTPTESGAMTLVVIGTVLAGVGTLSYMLYQALSSYRSTQAPQQEENRPIIVDQHDATSDEQAQDTSDSDDDLATASSSGVRQRSTTVREEEDADADSEDSSSEEEESTTTTPSFRAKPKFE